MSEPYGGRWDRILRRYVGLWVPGKGWVGEKPDAKNIHTIALAAQSIDYVMDFDNTMILAEGGRRSGKTTGSLAPKIIVALICFAALPGEVLSPTYRQSMNVWRAVLKLTPQHWWASKHRTDRVLTLANGSSVKLLSADRDDSARSEGVAWGAYDERQDISEEAAANAFLSTSEGGEDFIVFETATIKPELREHHDRLVESPNGRIYSMDSYGNPFIGHSFLDRAKEFIDEDLAKREIHGKWPELIGRVYPKFDADEHVRAYPLPGRTDVTAAVLYDKFGYAPPSSGDVVRLVGIDPPHSAVIYALYDDDTIHAVDEVVIGADGSGGDIRDLANAIKARAPHSVVIIDPHDTKYDTDLRKYLRRKRLRVATVKRMSQEYKLTAVRSRIEKGRFMVDPRCRFYASTLSFHQYKRGTPDKVQEHNKNKTGQAPGAQIQMVHIGDAGAYPIYKLWPARYDYESEEAAA